jgi:hypothetical protein
MREEGCFLEGYPLHQFFWVEGHPLPISGYKDPLHEGGGMFSRRNLFPTIFWVKGHLPSQFLGIRTLLHEGRGCLLEGPHLQFFG